MMRHALIAGFVTGWLVLVGIITPGCSPEPDAPAQHVDAPAPAEEQQAEPEAAVVEEAPAPPPEGTLSALPLMDAAEGPSWERLHLPLVLWDHYEPLITSIILSLDGARVSAAPEDWLGDGPPSTPQALAAAAVTAVRDEQKEAFLTLVAPADPEADLPDPQGFWDPVQEEFGGYASQEFRFWFRLGNLHGFTAVFEEPLDPADDPIQVWTFPVLQDTDTGQWQLAPAVLLDPRWGALSAIVHEEVKNRAIQVPVLTEEEAQRDHRIEFPRLWGDRDNAHPVAIHFDGGVPGPANPTLLEVTEEMEEIWGLFRDILADFSPNDPAFLAFIERISEPSAEFMKEFLDTRTKEVLYFWQQQRPAVEDVRFVIDAGSLYIFFYPSMREGPPDVFEFVRGRIKEGKLVLTNIGNDDYFGGVLTLPAFHARFMGIILTLEREQERAELDEAAEVRKQAAEEAREEARAAENVEESVAPEDAAPAAAVEQAPAETDEPAASPPVPEVSGEE